MYNITFVFIGSYRKKVLLIDSNFRNNTISRNFQSEPKLEDLFNGSISGKEAITVSSIKGIDTIGCKHSYNSPFEIAKRNLDLNIFKDLIDFYDYIFIEGPSLNRYTGTKELELVSEKIIGVFSASKVLEEPDKISIEYMKGLKDKFIGAVLNNHRQGNRPCHHLQKQQHRQPCLWHLC